MWIRRPHYYSAFQCLAGACPDTCCASWDIVIDEDHLAVYRSLPGPLGERIRGAITVDGEGDSCFSVAGGRCPLLTEERLCTIQLELGEAQVCDVCRSHPRFTEEYGTLREESLAASCPAVAELLLRDPAPARFLEEETAEPPAVCEDVDGSLLEALLPWRVAAIALIQDRTRPFGARLAGLLAFCQAAQTWLEWDELEELAALDSAWSPPEPLRGEPAVRREVMAHVLALLGELEVLEPAWEAELARAARRLYQERSAEDYQAACGRFRAARSGQEWEYEHLAVYLLYRWGLRADFDGDLYGKGALAVLSCLVVRELGLARWLEQGRLERRDQADLIHLWCKEQEHCAENLAALAQAAWTDPDLTPERLAQAALE